MMNANLEMFLYVTILCILRINFYPSIMWLSITGMSLTEMYGSRYLCLEYSETNDGT